MLAPRRGGASLTGGLGRALRALAARGWAGAAPLSAGEARGEAPAAEGAAERAGGARRGGEEAATAAELKQLVEDEIRLRTPLFASRQAQRAARRPPANVRAALQAIVHGKTKKAGRRARFTETVEAAVHLAVDPKRSDQIVRGTAFLPHSVGRKEVVAVFVDDDEDAAAAKAAGAALTGGASLAAAVREGGGKLPFTKALATPGGLVHAREVGRILGPKGLMPNAKDGTVVSDVATSVARMLKGQVKFRMDKGGIVHAPLGKVDMPLQVLEGNLAALMEALYDAKPEGLKGTAATDAGFVTKAYLGRTMGKSHAIYTSDLLDMVRALRGPEDA